MLDVLTYVMLLDTTTTNLKLPLTSVLLHVFFIHIQNKPHIFNCLYCLSAESFKVRSFNCSSFLNYI